MIITYTFNLFLVTWTQWQQQFLFLFKLWTKISTNTQLLHTCMESKILQSNPYNFDKSHVSTASITQIANISECENCHHKFRISNFLCKTVLSKYAYLLILHNSTTYMYKIKHKNNSNNSLNMSTQTYYLHWYFWCRRFYHCSKEKFLS